MKNKLIKKLEHFLLPDNYNFNKEKSLNACWIIAFMSQI